MFETAQKDLTAVLKKHGIGTYILIIKDPDSDLEACDYDGPSAWIIGQGILLAERSKRSYLETEEAN